MNSPTLLALVFGVLAASSPTLAEENKNPAESAPVIPLKPIAKDYCSSFVDAAAERRLARLADDLRKRRDELATKIEELKATSGELKVLIDTRKAMQDKVKESILKIYLQVEPEAAAQQLAKLEPTTAAEILAKMNAKRSGEILTLMEPKRAASLVAILTLQTRSREDRDP